MTLQEAESKLSDLNNKIAELLSEREEVIKEWNIAFNSENPENNYRMPIHNEPVSFSLRLSGLLYMDNPPKIIIFVV